MEQRKGEFEAGIGATLITPYALLSARISSDVTGRSNGQELLLWADFPVIKDNLLIMPGMGLMIRSSNMANYYFGGVSASEATSQRPQWDTGTTVSPMAAIITSYRFSPTGSACSPRTTSCMIKISPTAPCSAQRRAVWHSGRRL